jgi:hypothetical protein
MMLLMSYSALNLRKRLLCIYGRNQVSDVKNYQFHHKISKISINYFKRSATSIDDIKKTLHLDPVKTADEEKEQ